MKRLTDLLIASMALLLVSPFLLGVAAAIRLGDGGPVIFRQRRIGLNGQPFDIFKFRSMVVNAERLGSHSTADGDSRITPVGKFIRRTSLDELPQLLNVILGDMSVVGPRPDVPAQRQDYSELEWAERHRMRPGITGLAQATLRSEATAEQRLALDLQYVRNASVTLDLKIMLMTLRQVFGRGGN